MMGRLYKPVFKINPSDFDKNDRCQNLKMEMEASKYEMQVNPVHSLQFSGSTLSSSEGNEIACVTFQFVCQKSLLVHELIYQSEVYLRVRLFRIF